MGYIKEEQKAQKLRTEIETQKSFENFPKTENLFQHQYVTSLRKKFEKI